MKRVGVSPAACAVLHCGAPPHTEKQLAPKLESIIFLIGHASCRTGTAKWALEHPLLLDKWRPLRH